jgi:hypothetical protein
MESSREARRLFFDLSAWLVICPSGEGLICGWRSEFAKINDTRKVLDNNPVELRQSLQWG